MLRWKRAAIAAAVLAACAWAQNYTINTVAGGGLPPTPNAALSSPVGPAWVACDSAGSLYFSSTAAVFKVDSTGTMIRVAGSPGGASPLGDGGPAASARLIQPAGLAFDSAGSLYIADYLDNRVRKVTPAGVISTVAGNGAAGHSGDGGPATRAQLNGPSGLAVDLAGNLYIADSLSDYIRKVTPDGTISTFAGIGVGGLSGDGGPATRATLFQPEGLAVDSAGNLYIADVNNCAIRKVTPAGTISTVAGNGISANIGNGGPASNAEFEYPYAVAVDSSGNLYIADDSALQIRKISTAGIITDYAGGGGGGNPGDGGPAVAATFVKPMTVAADSKGNLYVADWGTNTIRKITAAGEISTVAGSGTTSFGDGGLATSGGLDGPQGVVADAGGNLYIADSSGNRVRKVSPNGTITTVAGNGQKGYSGDGGPATSATLDTPVALAIDSLSNLYISEYNNDTVRKVTPAGTISTFAGNGTWGYSGEGKPAISGGLSAPSGLAADASDNLYIAENMGNRVRKVTPDGVISTVAGNGKTGYSGDGGPATAAMITIPNGIAVDASGNLYIVDGYYYVIRKVTPAGIISTFAGNAFPNYNGDGGPATKAGIGNPSGVAADSSGNVFLTHSVRSVPDFTVVRMVAPSGIISTIAGSGARVYSGDGGAATGASFGAGLGLAADSSGKVFVADSMDDVVRVLVPANLMPSIADGGVVPSGSTVNTIQPGEWVSIYGSNLANTVAVWKGDFPTTLGGTIVTIDSRPAYLSYVSPSQINLQVPDDAATGPVSVAVTTPSGTATSTATLAAVAPAFLLLDNKHVAGIILRPDGSGSQGGGAYDILGPTGNSLGYPTVPAKAGDTVELFATGFVPTNPAVPPGQAYSGTAPALDAVNVAIGGWNVTPMFAGLSGAGLFQINLTIAGGEGPGDVPLVATAGGAQTPSGVVISLR